MFIANQQFDLLRTMLRTLVGDNPFYTRKLEAADASSVIRNLAEFTEEVPFTTRAELDQDQRANPPLGTNVTYPLNRYARCLQQQQAGGDLWRWLDTAESWQAQVENGAEVFRTAGVAAGDRIFFTDPNPGQPGPWLALESGALAGGFCLCGDGLAGRAQLQAVLDLEATVLCGPAANLRRRADAAGPGEVDLGRSQVRLILAGGEPGGTALVRDRFAALWPNARCYDHVGLTEAGPMAGECPARPGVFHVLELSFLAEIVDPASGRPAEEGQAGELILTTLQRLGSPLLRYRTGWLVRAAVETACECGRHFLALEGGILGQVQPTPAPPAG